MTKAMLFIDGTWLYCNTPRMGAAYGRPGYHIDFGKLPGVVGAEIEAQLGRPADILRTHLFATYADNCDPRDEEVRQRRLDFFTRLREDYHYDLEVFPVDFAGRRLRRADRDAGDHFEPRDKRAEIALACAMLYNAVMPRGFDIAVAVLGDADFAPVLQTVRKLGKRVVLVSMRASCAAELVDRRGEAGVRDFSPIWLDGLLDTLELKFSPHVLACESPMHCGDRDVVTTFYPRHGQQFFCEPCRAEFARLRSGAEEWPPTQGSLRGQVIKKVADRGFGFIHATDGRDYFFHLADLAPQLAFEDLSEGMEVEFAIKRPPGAQRGGTAQNIRRCPQDRDAALDHNASRAGGFFYTPQSPGRD